MSRLDEEWERCKPWIANALARDIGTHLLEDVKAEIDRTEAILWPGEKSAIVTQVCIYPRKRILTVWLAGGDMDELTNLMYPRIEVFARQAKFDRMMIAGRFGWQRVMAKFGYEPVSTVIGKEL